MLLTAESEECLDVRFRLTVDYGSLTEITLFFCSRCSWAFDSWLSSLEQELLSTQAMPQRLWCRAASEVCLGICNNQWLLYVYRAVVFFYLEQAAQPSMRLNHFNKEGYVKILTLLGNSAGFCDISLHTSMSWHIHSFAGYCQNCGRQ